MSREGISYQEVLKEAQELGYAERNPEADVEGYDACRKIAILSSLACGHQVDFDEAMHRGTMYKEFETHAREAACNLLKKEAK